MKKYQVWEHQRVTNWDGTHDSDDYLHGTFESIDEAKKCISNLKKPNLDPSEYGLSDNVLSIYKIVEIE